MQLFIRSGPARVLASGSVTAFAAHPLRFDLGPAAVVLRFTTAPDVEDVAVRAATAEDGAIVLELINFDGADGRGSAVPVPLGEVEGGMLYLHFRVFRFGRTEDRTVTYTFYLSAEGPAPR